MDRPLPSSQGLPGALHLQVGFCEIFLHPCWHASYCGLRRSCAGSRVAESSWEQHLHPAQKTLLSIRHPRLLGPTISLLPVLGRPPSVNCRGCIADAPSGAGQSGVTHSLQFFKIMFLVLISLPMIDALILTLWLQG